MRTKIEHIARSLTDVLDGEPWYGQPVMAILHHIDPAVVYKRPGGEAHSLIELLYHMITWTEFTADRLEKKKMDEAAFDKLDWRVIDPGEHDWEKGNKRFREANDTILELIAEKSDELLNEKVDYRDYDFGHLLNGLIQHHIYHSGQVAAVGKMF
jgi:uncharacterized damage-inducible protein DinB